MRTLIAIIALLAAYALAGQEDYEAAVQAERLYCENVEAGHWPAYNPDIKCPNKPDERK